MRLWRPRTTSLLIGGVVVIILASAVAFIVATFEPKTEIRMGSGIFNARVVDDEVGREKGLSSVSSLHPNEALLMVFQSDGAWGIWMKNMKVPIDIVWLDSTKKVVHIVKNASPGLSTTKTFKPMSNARYVVEIAAGGVDKNNIRIGEKALFVLEGEDK